MSTSTRRSSRISISNQAEKCARFKRECESDVEHISGLDWCDDVDYHDYVPKGTIYPTQPECLLLKL
jgi:hypothetical protein